MTTATPPAPYSTMEGALASGFATTQLHHSVGHDRHEPSSHILSIGYGFDLACDVTNAFFQLAQISEQICE